MRRLAIVVIAVLYRLVQPLPALAQPPADPGSEAPKERAVLSFAEAVQRAVTRNPDALTAQAEIRRARALVEAARSQSLPSLNGTLSYTRINNDRLLGGNLIVARDTLLLTAVLAVPIIAPVPWAQWSHARDDLNTAQASAAAVRRAVATATARAYLSVLTQRRLLAISVLSRDTAKAHYDFARTRARGGLGNRLDEMRALDELKSDDASVELAELAVTRAQEAIGVLLGEERAPDVEDKVELTEIPQEAAVTEDLLRVRADLVLLTRRRAAAAAVLADSWRDFAPQLLGSLSGALQTPETATVPSATWQAQLVLMLPIWDGGLRYGVKRERRAVVDQADIAVDNGMRVARAELRVAFSAMQHAERALIMATEAANAAQDALNLSNLAYRGGTISNLEVIDAERRQRAASVQVAIEQDSVYQARLDVLTAAGMFY